MVVATVLLGIVVLASSGIWAHQAYGITESSLKCFPKYNVRVAGVR